MCERLCVSACVFALALGLLEQGKARVFERLDRGAHSVFLPLTWKVCVRAVCVRACVCVRARSPTLHLPIEIRDRALLLPKGLMRLIRQCHMLP